MEIFLPQGNAPNGRRDYCVRCLISSLQGKSKKKKKKKGGKKKKKNKKKNKKNKNKK